MNEQDDVDGFRTDLDDPTNLIVQDFDLKGVVLIIPIDAPLPSELDGVELPKGSLYDRLRPITREPENEFAVVPLAGAELLALDRVWRTFQVAKRVLVLRELPGARYDVTFDQGSRLLGLKTVDWPSIADAMAKRVRTMQRTKDSEPWKLPPLGKEPTEEVMPEDDVRGTIRVPKPRDDEYADS